MHMSGIQADTKQLVQRGINKLLRMDAPNGLSVKDDEKYITDRRVIDTFDLIESFEVLRGMFNDSMKLYQTPIKTNQGMIDVSKGLRKGDEEMNVIQDVIDAAYAFYMTGATEKDTILAQRRNRALINMVITPLLDLFRDLPTEDVFASFNSVIDSAIEYTINSDIIAHPDDAVVVRKQIAREVARTYTIRKIVNGIMQLRKKSKKKRIA